MTEPPLSPTLRALRVASIVETATYLVLLAGVVYHLAGGPRLTAITGSVHGVVFLAYAALVLKAREETGWGPWPTLKALVAAAVPFGAYVVVHGLLAERRTVSGRR